MTEMARWYPVLLLIPALCYLAFAYGLVRIDNKVFTGLAWASYVQANVFFFIAYMRGE